NYKAVTLTLTPANGAARVRADPPLAGVQWPATVPVATGTECGDWITALAADFSNLSQVRFAGRFPASCGERVWQLAFPDPAGYTLRAVAAMWRDMGGQLRGGVRDGSVPPAQKPAFEFASPPLGEVVRDI